MTTTRRDYGSGSVYQRKSDGLWIGTIEAGWTATGARRRVTVSAKTKAEAKRKLQKKQVEIDSNGTPVVSARATTKSWAEEWLPMAERTMRPSSFVSARAAVNLWIIPTIGHKKFAELTPADIRAVATAQRKAGRSSSTELRTHSVLMTMLKAAMLEGHTVHPRLLAVKAPRKAVTDRDAMTVEQALAILPWAGSLHHGSRFLAALLQGMRQGESLGLTWPSVDLDANTITVEWQAQALPYRIARDRTSGFRIPDGYEVRHLQGALHLVRPKSKAGYRVIPIVPVMRDALLAWREVQADLITDNPHGLVWPNLDGAPTYYKVDDEEWYGLQQAADVQHPAGRLFSIHEARHTTATLLLECGVDPAVIVAIMGHSSILTTRGYQHVRTERAMAALELVADRLQLG
ncbi:tyrosine-type recombinase/integrase [Nocardioides stalactiti]|uniref:tyrosine-type recombinase/integrase n=1 Tax=Nocardioides stalactiti TaxID=2755356 RepID=UPI0016014E4F|nr:site-specific integrase [Nocardioides stalactiti]